MPVSREPLFHPLHFLHRNQPTTMTQCTVVGGQFRYASNQGRQAGSLANHRATTGPLLARLVVAMLISHTSAPPLANNDPAAREWACPALASASSAHRRPRKNDSGQYERTATRRAETSTTPAETLGGKDQLENLGNRVDTSLLTSPYRLSTSAGGLCSAPIPDEPQTLGTVYNGATRPHRLHLQV